ncbi:single-stranded-DNA-specific exonuclease RecJ [candidate division KSB1 bacterium]|nr:single-stranded-DNA-specific exonuclease RecJ [candidate division KSB1 bacterium]TDI96403.1 MAG: single-stranded-DNA-specific exonuclease RecJ [Caldithrix sp.]
MEFRWEVLNNHDSRTINEYADQLNSSPVLARILLNRGIANIETARRFLKPELSHLHDPFLLAGMQDAVERIAAAITNKEKILIYGDYDVDGTTATSMLLLFFRNLGQDVGFYIPDRLLEGYGLSEKGMVFAKENGLDLIITVDCGITAVDEVKLANEFGIDVIICDHHQPAQDLPPAMAILNPKREDCTYPFKELAGVGVAFKLLQALQRHLALDESTVMRFLGLVSIGSSADIVPLVDENRVIVKHGLQSLSEPKSIGLEALIDSSGLSDREIGTGQVVFVLAPRINAVGRMGDAGRAVRLLTSDNKQQAKNIATILESENRRRKSIDEETFSQAFEIIESDFNPGEESFFVLHKQGWHPGVIGIVASRLVEKFYRPTLMIATDEKGLGRGSARSIAGFNIYEALKECEDLMVNFGGHKYAAGLTIEIENIPLLREKLSQIAAKQLTDDMLKPKLSIDSEIRFHEIDGQLIKLINRMAPFGPQNMRPLFLSKGLHVVGTPSVVGRNHLKLKVRQDGVIMDAIGFDLGEKIYRISPGEQDVEMVYIIDENEYKGRKTIQLRVKDLR